VVQGRTDKLAALRELAGRLKVPPDLCIYMGDDDIDAPAMRWAGIGVAVPGAVPAALAAADLVTAHGGGLGAVREICDRLLAARGLSPGQ
jgi:3-deoxy-D-manno-octulosonate 8-phosphate phosphatase (KDO 8-P phosphatase)